MSIWLVVCPTFADRGRVNNGEVGTAMGTADHLGCFTAGEQHHRFKQHMLLEQLINTCHHHGKGYLY